MRVIGITGGVGSGKSGILDLLERDYNAQVIQADQVAKELMEPGRSGYQKLLSVFGSQLLGKDKKIDCKGLADRMFRDRDVIHQVNSIIHPMVWEAIRKKSRESGCGLVVVEAAIVDENHSDIYGELWYVYTSEENRIQRLAKSRGYTREKSLGVMANQLTEAEFRLLADEVIDNNGSLEETRQQVDAILKKKDDNII